MNTENESQLTRDNSRESDVVIAGYGMITPLGIGIEENWANLRAGRSGISEITKFDARGYQSRIAGEVTPSDDTYRSVFLDREPYGHKQGLAFRALDEALRVASIHRSELSNYRIGVFTGCEKETNDKLGIFKEYLDPSADQNEIAFRHDMDLAARYSDDIARAITSRLEQVVVVANYAMACASGAVAIAQAVRWIRRGRIDCALVVGADVPITSGTLLGFQLLGALSTQTAHPTKASRPFDAERDGFVLSEGAGVLVLLSSRQARRRDSLLGRIVGIGMTNNRHHITNIPKSGVQAAIAMRRALTDARLSPQEINYINAHGTSTDVGDIAESNAIISVFEVPPPVSSTKSMTGHLVAASGTVELIITALAVTRGYLPPTINQTTRDSECPLDYIPNQGRAAADAKYAMSNSFGFGGTNVSIIVGR